MTTPGPDPDDAPLARRLLHGARPFLLTMAAVVAVALAAGLLLSRADPRQAARMLLSGQVVTEAAGEATGPPAPTSGEADGAPTCGVREDPVAVQAQVDAIVAGVIVVQYRDEEDATAVVEAVADQPTKVLVGPNPDVGGAVVATAWGRRLRLDEVNEQLLRAFVTANAGIGPDVTACAS